jgi:hypothetical protein
MVTTFLHRIDELQENFNFQHTEQNTQSPHFSIKFNYVKTILFPKNILHSKKIPKKTYKSHFPKTIQKNQINNQIS